MNRHAANRSGSHLSDVLIWVSVLVVILVVLALLIGAMRDAHLGAHVGTVVLGLTIASLPVWFAVRAAAGTQSVTRAGVLLLTLGLLAAATQDTYGLALLLVVPGSTAILFGIASMRAKTE